MDMTFEFGDVLKITKEYTLAGGYHLVRVMYLDDGKAMCVIPEPIPDSSTWIAPGVIRSLAMEAWEKDDKWPS